MVAYYLESVHLLYFSFECHCRFYKSQDKAYRARLLQITSKVTKTQGGRSATKAQVDTNRTIHGLQSRVSNQPLKRVNILEHEPVVKEEED